MDKKGFAEGHADLRYRNWPWASRMRFLDEVFDKKCSCSSNSESCDVDYIKIEPEISFDGDINENQNVEPHSNHNNQLNTNHYNQSNTNPQNQSITNPQNQSITNLNNHSNTNHNNQSNESHNDSLNINHKINNELSIQDVNKINQEAEIDLNQEIKLEYESDQSTAHVFQDIKPSIWTQRKRRRNSSVDNCSMNSYDSVDLLFMSYAKTFKTLSGKNQAKLKVTLAEVFAAFEMKEMGEPYSPPSRLDLSAIDADNS